MSGDRGLLGMCAVGLFAGFIGYAAVFHRLHKDRARTASLLGVDTPD